VFFCKYARLLGLPRTVRWLCWRVAGDKPEAVEVALAEDWTPEEILRMVQTDLKTSLYRRGTR
jgi:hypothetical protein